MIATIGSIFSIISSPLESFHLLVWGRFFEAVGSSAGLAVSVAMINDFYFLLLYGLMLIIPTKLLPETNLTPDILA